MRVWKVFREKHTRDGVLFSATAHEWHVHEHRPGQETIVGIWPGYCYSNPESARLGMAQMSVRYLYEAGYDRFTTWMCEIEPTKPNYPIVRHPYAMPRLPLSTF